jgi:hypothetical protein
MKKVFADSCFVLRLYMRLCLSLFVGAWRGFEAEYDRTNAELTARFRS